MANESTGQVRRVVIYDDSNRTCGYAAELSAIIADRAFDALKAPVKRVTVPNVAMPYAPNAEARVFPGEEQITKAALSVTRVAA